MILRIEGLGKHFGGVIALREVGLSVRLGEIIGLIGPNGAGKTTLFNCITGVCRPDSGRIVLGEYGEDITGLTPDKITRRGVARTFQNARLFASMSVLENVMAGTFVRTSGSMAGAIWRSLAVMEEERAVRRRSEELLRFMGLEERAADLAAGLPFGGQRRLEIARALATEPRLLLMDEPAAGMNPQEKLELVETIRKICAGGVTVLIIEHDMKVVMRVCRRIIVLDSGEKVCEGTPEEVRRDPKVISAYLGTEKYDSAG